MSSSPAFIVPRRSAYACVRAVKVTSTPTGATARIGRQPHRLVRLDDLDRDGPDDRRVRIVAIRPREVPEQALAVHEAEFVRVEHLPLRVVRHREDHGVAHAAARVHAEVEALAPVVVMHRDVQQRLRDLVAEQFVGGDKLGHSSGRPSPQC